MMRQSAEIDPYLARGLVGIAISIAVYVSIDEPGSALTVLLILCFLSGSLMAISSPKRWSVDTTLKLYRVILSLPGIGSFVFGIYHLFTTGSPALAAVPIGLSLILLIPLAVTPWDEVRAYLAYVKDPANDVSDAVAPIPPRLYLRGRYAAVGSLAVIFAVVVLRLYWPPSIGTLAALAGVVGTGLVNVWCSPFSGSPEQVVIRRRLRWAILGLGSGVSSLYGFLFTDAQVPAAFWGAVTLGIAYWLFVGANWEAVREEIADLQSDARTDWG